MLPDQAELWTLLATFKATVDVQVSHHSQADGLLVARWTEITFDARRQTDSAADQIFQPVNLSQVISLISLGYLLTADGKASLTATQKAVHCNPHSAAPWSVLFASALPAWSAESSGQRALVGFLIESNVNCWSVSFFLYTIQKPIIIKTRFKSIINRIESSLETATYHEEMLAVSPDVHP